MATGSKIYMQNSATPLMEQLTFFHDHTLLILTMITIWVGYLMETLFFNSLTNRFLWEGQTIELIWTILPAIILLFIVLPSLRLLSLLDEIDNPSITLKIVMFIVMMMLIGHQWCWSYNILIFLL